MSTFASSFTLEQSEAPRPTRGRGSSMRSWRLLDRLIFIAAWGAGLGLCLITGAIVVYMGVRGFQYLRPELLVTRPQEGASQEGAGGFLDPLIGTAVLTAIGLAIALPLGVCSAAWIVEYGRPSWLARMVESAIEIVAGTPDIVIAIFGLAIFELSFMGVFSSKSPSGVVIGRSFIAAGAMMS
ncbi:MAG TPA: ABC transporter permease, partial [Solirubrobacteraceae bacterium]